MSSLKGKNIILRALEPSDIDWLFSIENNTSFWEVSNTLHPYSKNLLKKYLDNAHQDIYAAKQLRLVIEHLLKPIGLIDLFDFDPHHHRAGVGILVLPEFQSNGIATEALEILADYCFNNLQLHQLYANITSENFKSIELFEKTGFKLIGNKEEWNYINGEFKDELLFQLLKNDH